MLTYKGYTGHCTLDFADNLITGEVLGTRDVISFGGSTPEEAERSFHQSVDDYLAFCAKMGRDPEKPYSGKFLFRMTPQQHRQIDEAARLAGVSVNSLIADRVFAETIVSECEQTLGPAVESIRPEMVPPKLSARG